MSSVIAELVIRRAREGDAEILCNAEREIARTPARLVSVPEELQVPSFAAKIRDLHAAGTYLVAERDGVVVGHAFLDFVSTVSRMKHVRCLNMVVHTGYAGQGIGTALLRELQAIAPQASVERIELRVRSKNVAAVNLYKKCGFEEECTSLRRIKLEDGSYLDDLSMVWFAPPKIKVAQP
jgi:ribosomal protein S18 acetylase RimI-like enzyme